MVNFMKFLRFCRISDQHRQLVGFHGRVVSSDKQPVPMKLAALRASHKPRTLVESRAWLMAQKRRRIACYKDEWEMRSVVRKTDRDFTDDTIQEILTQNFETHAMIFAASGKAYQFIISPIAVEALVNRRDIVKPEEVDSIRLVQKQGDMSGEYFSKEFKSLRAVRSYLSRSISKNTSKFTVREHNEEVLNFMANLLDGDFGMKLTLKLKNSEIIELSPVDVLISSDYSRSIFRKLAC